MTTSKHAARLNVTSFVYSVQKKTGKEPHAKYQVYERTDVS